MNTIEKIQKEYETATHKKQELSETLKKTEKATPDDFYQIWLLRDQIAYWEGKSEGLKFALDELQK